jgi:hypothetical protein
VNHKGTEYKGRHEPLVSHEVFARVQEVLFTQRGAGTRARTHHHYLKGTLWCQRCKRPIAPLLHAHRADTRNSDGAITDTAADTTSTLLATALAEPCSSNATWVELWGFEPQASSMPWRRATNCAIAPWDVMESSGNRAVRAPRRGLPGPGGPPRGQIAPGHVTLQVEQRPPVLRLGR